MDTSKEVVNILELKVNASDLTAKILAGKKSIQEYADTIKELSKDEATNAAQIVELTAKRKVEQDIVRSNTAFLETLIATQRLETGSVEQMRKELALVTRQWAELTAEERNNTEHGKELTAHKLSLTQSISALEEVTGDHRRNVGNYHNSIISALTELQAEWGNLTEEEKVNSEKGQYLIAKYNLLTKSMAGQDKTLDAQADQFKSLSISIDAAAKASGAAAASFDDKATPGIDNMGKEATKTKEEVDELNKSLAITGENAENASGKAEGGFGSAAGSFFGFNKILMIIMISFAALFALLAGIAGAFVKAGDDANSFAVRFRDSMLEASKSVMGLRATILTQGLAALKALGAAFATLLLNPVVLFLAAITVALTTLFAAFKRTEQGADTFAVVSAKIGAILNEIMGIIGSLAIALYDVFSEPKKAIQDLGEAISTYFSAKLSEFMRSLTLAGGAIKKVFSGDFKGAVADAESALDALMNAVPLSVEDMKKMGKSMGEAWDKAAERVANAAKEAGALRAAEIALMKAQTASKRELASLNAELAKRQKAMADERLTLQTRVKETDAYVKAMERAHKVEISLAKMAAANLRTQYNIARRNNAANQRELASQLADAEAAVIATVGRTELALQDAYTNRTHILRQLSEEELMLMAETADAYRVRLEAEASNEETSTDRQRAIMVELNSMNDTLQAKAEDMFIARTDAALDFAELSQELDAAELRRKLANFGLDEKQTVEAIALIRKRQEAQLQASQQEAQWAKDIEQQKTDFVQSALDAQAAMRYANAFDQIAADKMRLEIQYQAEVDYAKRLGADTTEIEARYSQARKDIATTEAMAKLQVAQQVADNIAQIAGEGTAIAKAAAVASTTIAAFVSASEAYKATVGTPIIGPIAAPIAAAAALAAGMANVRAILAVKTTLPGSRGGSGSIGTPSTPAPPAMQAPELGRGLVQRDARAPEAKPADAQIVVPVDSVTAKQRTQASIRQAATL